MKKDVLELIYDDNKDVYDLLALYDQDFLNCIPNNEKTHTSLMKHEASDLIEAVEFFEIKQNYLFQYNRKQELLKIISIFESCIYHTTVEERAASLFYSVINNHIYPDGNKRLACWLLQWYLSNHGFQDCLSAEILLVLAIMVAQSPPDDVMSIRTVLIQVFLNQNHHKHSMAE